MIQKQIDALVQSFTRDINSLVRESAMNAASAALGPARAITNGSTAPARPLRNANGGTRSPSPRGLEARMLEQLSAAPNLRTEQIGLALGVPTNRIKPLLAQLVASGVLSKRGQRRGTRYSIAK